MEKSPLTQPYSSLSSVVAVHPTHSLYVDLLIYNPEIAAAALPGQFIMIRSWPDGNPLLLRPFDIVHADPTAGTVQIVFKVEGKGTRLLSKLRPGAEVLVTGPLGRGIRRLEARRIALLTRGVGSAAVVYLANWAHARGIEIDAFLSAAGSDRLVCSDYIESSVHTLHIATDDGSRGYHGDARELVSEALAEAEQAGNPIEVLFTCGSRRFARFVQQIDQSGRAAGFIFLEEYMACGMGDCHGCAIPRADGNGYWLACQDGPIFSAGEVTLE